MSRWAETTLLLCGIALLGDAGWKTARYYAFETDARWLLHAAPQSWKTEASTRPENGSLLGRPAFAGAPNVLGRLKIPRLGMSVLVLEGDDDAALSLGAGHLVGTAPIGGMGNTVIAGHRDTAFRELRRIRLGDQISIEGEKTESYVVRTIQVVDPDDIQVLNSSKQRELTLLTCYPFTYLGSAPKRYVIRAEGIQATSSK
jgi:sortase A